jgi:hypothetical protein
MEEVSSERRRRQQVARRDLTNEEIERMGRDNPGSAAEYLNLRREELEAEEQKRREADDKERFVERFVAAGGDRADASAELKRLTNERAAQAARRADEDASGYIRRSITEAL